MKKAIARTAKSKSPKLRLHKDSLRKLSDAFLKDVHGGGNSTCGGNPCPCPTPPPYRSYNGVSCQIHCYTDCCGY